MSRRPPESVLLPVVDEWQRASRGDRVHVVDRLCRKWGVSRPTVYSWFKPYQTARMSQIGEVIARKVRDDAGTSALTLDEARLIAAAQIETVRDNGKGEAAIGDIVATLRANGLVLAGRVDAETGEFTPLSVSAIRRAMRKLGYHPSQLSTVRPAMELRSPYPNWCWQIDASMCRQYYLGDAGTESMDKLRFYRGKPENFEKIAQRRIWRYVVTDHCSGALEVLYVQGAESSANLLVVLMHAMTQRSDGTMHGVPKILMTDPGSAMTAQATRNFCTALGIRLIINEVGNARAKGQVENGNYLVETKFESTLRFRPPVSSIAEMNQLAREWCRHFNATAEHGRTKMTRRDGWHRITPEQLVFAPAPNVMQQLPLTDPKPCTVRDLQLRFKGKRYDLRGLPELTSGQRVDVVANPLEPRTVRVLTLGPDGQSRHFIAHELELNDWGSWTEAPVIGEEFKSLPESAAQARAKELDRLAMGVETDAESKKARRAKRIPFGGAIDPMKAHRSPVVTALPRAGTASEITAAPIATPVPVVPIERPTFVAKPLDLIPMVMEIKRRMEARGGVWEARHYEIATVRWPQGVLEEQLDACVLALMAPALKAMKGGAA